LDRACQDIDARRSGSSWRSKPPPLFLDRHPVRNARAGLLICRRIGRVLRWRQRKCWTIAQMPASDLPKPPMPQLLALLEQVEFVLAITSPATSQQVEIWPELRQRAKDARAAVRLAEAGPVKPMDV